VSGWVKVKSQGGLQVYALSQTLALKPNTSWKIGHFLGFKIGNLAQFLTRVLTSLIEQTGGVAQSVQNLVDTMS
jgi:hypothetical protein